MSIREIFNKIKGQDPNLLSRWKQNLHIQLVSKKWLIAYRMVVDERGSPSSETFMCRDGSQFGTLLD
jgi:hypothetical protein